MYAYDNQDNLVLNVDPNHVSPGPLSWANGVLDWTLNSGNTNTAYLTDPQYALLGPYINQPLSFHCPGDYYLCQAQHAAGWSCRVRSVAMDAAVGAGQRYTEFPFSASFFVATKMSQLRNPGVSDSWLFTDENPDSIDDCILYTFYGYTTGTGQFTEIPGSNHGAADGISFCDGHAEIHKWQTAALLHNVDYTVYQKINVVNNADLAWLAVHTPAPP